MSRLNELATQLRKIASEVDILVLPSVIVPPVVPPVVAPPAGRTSLLDSYPNEGALIADSVAIKNQYAITVDGRQVVSGFGPGPSYFTASNGSVANSKPPAPAHAMLADSYPSQAALINDANALQYMFAVMVDGVAVRQGFGPPVRFISVAGGAVKRA